MSNPITELQGGGPWPDEVVTPLPTQQAPQPQAPAPGSGTTPPSIPPMTLDMNPAPPPELQGGGPFSEDVPGAARPSALTSPAVPETLGGPATSATLTPTLPKTTGNQEAYNYLAPRVQEEALGARRQAQETYNSALDPNAVPVQREWEAPDLEGSITRFGYNSKVLADSFKRQTAARQNEDERSWLERNMAAIEAMNKPPTSATANSMDWVTRLLGASEDGVRQYVGAAVFDKAKGEWVGSPVGAVLYGLGVLQNSAMGAIYDVTNLFHNVDKGMRQAYESFTPPWARGTTDSALKTLGSVLPLLGGSVLGGGKGVTAGKYNDGKSNFVEALRGAQYSFTDKAGSGLGLNADKAFRVNTPFSVSEKGFSKDKPGVIDINPGVLVGTAIDVLIGGKIDKIAGAFLPKFLKLADKAPTIEGQAPRLEAPTTGSLSSTGGEARQLEIPFTSGPVPTNKVAKTKELKARVSRPSKDVQQVLPIKEMMTEFGVADRATNPLAYKQGINPTASGQLSLPLGQIFKTPLPPLNPLVKAKKATGAGKQLKIEFDILPEAVPPKVRKSVDLVPSPEAVNSLDELPPAIRGKVLNVMERKTLAALDEVQSSMVGKPDIGRRFSASVPDTGVEYTPILPPNLIKNERISVDNVPFFHGTRVRDLDIPTIDPTKGAAFSELGTGIYITADNSIATLAAKSAPSQGLPSVPGRELYSNAPAPGALPRGAVHELFMSQDAVIIDATKPIDAIRVVAERVSKQFPELKGMRYDDKSLTQILTMAAMEEPNAAKRLQFQQKLAEALRVEGVDGVKSGDNYSIYNPQVLEEVNRKSVLGLGGDYNDARLNRHQLEKWGFENSKSPIAEANMLDTRAEALSEELTAFELKKLLAANQTFEEINMAGLMDHPNRVPTLDEFAKLSIQDMYLTEASGNSLGMRPSVPEQEVKEMYARVVEYISTKGVPVKTKEMEPGVGGYFHPQDLYKDTYIGMPAGAATGGDISKLETLIHEVTHAEIDKYIPYLVGTKGVTVNESIADSVASTVIGMLFPNQRSHTKVGFDEFYQYLNDPVSIYKRDFDNVPMYKEDALSRAGSIATELVKELVEKFSPGFKSPALNELRMFGAQDYSGWAIDHFAKAPSLKHAFDSSLVTLADGLSDATKIGKMATNPVSGKLNTDVLEFLRVTFADELSLVDNTVQPKLLRQLAEDISGNTTSGRLGKAADAVLEKLDQGGKDYESYLALLRKESLGDTKFFDKYNVATELQKPKLLEEWAMSLVANDNKYTAETAREIRDTLRKGGVDYNEYYEVLMDVDLHGYKKYETAAKNEIDDYLQRVYCGGN